MVANSLHFFLISLASQDIKQQAKDWPPQRISQFLERLGKKDHAKTFLDRKINGILLLSAEREVYEALGVTSYVEYAQIAVLFRRELMAVETIHCSVSEFFLMNEELTSHAKTLEEAGVDIDMLKFVQQNELMKELLKELGLDPVEILRISFAIQSID